MGRRWRSTPAGNGGRRGRGCARSSGGWSGWKSEKRKVESVLAAAEGAGVAFGGGAETAAGGGAVEFAGGVVAFVGGGVEPEADRAWRLLVRLTCCGVSG